MNSAVGFLTVLTRETRKTESEVVAMAFDAGLRTLWREHILGKYLRGEINRVDAVRDVGIDLVELAERQQKAVQEDLNWGMNP